MTSIVLKPGITLLDIVSTRMLGQVGFMATVFDIFNSNGISVDVVATSEVSISLTLDPRYVACNSCRFCIGVLRRMHAPSFDFSLCCFSWLNAVAACALM